MDTRSLVKWKESPLYNPERDGHQRSKKTQPSVCPDTPQGLQGLTSLVYVHVCLFVCFFLLFLFVYCLLLLSKLPACSCILEPFSAE